MGSDDYVMVPREPTEERREVAHGLLTLAAGRSVTTPFGWSHPDCELLEKAARLLKNEPAPRTDGPVDGVLSAAPPSPRSDEGEGKAVAWARDRFIVNDDGVRIGTDDPEIEWSKEAPDIGWWPLFAAPPSPTPSVSEIFTHATPKCDHEFSGWRNFEDGNGGEQVCKKCGIGAMSASLRDGP